MGLRERNRCKLMVALAGRTLEADADESFRVRDILCLPEATDTFLELLVDGTTVAKIRVKGKAGNHAPFPTQETAVAQGATSQITTGCAFGLLRWLRAHGIDLSIPVATGQVLTVSQVPATGRVCVVFDQYDAGDVARDEPNGSEASLRRYLHYAEMAAAAAATPALVAESLMWTGGDKWPFDGSGVPDGVTMRILGIVGSPVSMGDASDNIANTTHLQLLREATVLFDPDRDGLPFLGDVTNVAATADYTPIASVIGPHTPEYGVEPLLLDPPLVFGKGERLTTQLVVASGNTLSLAAALPDVAYIMEAERA